LNQPAENVSDVLSQLTDEERVAVVSLPYRVGLYVSFSDLSGGWDAQEQELEMLTSILREFAEDFCKGEFSQKVLAECLRGRDKWPAWSQNIDTVPAEAEMALETINLALSEKSLLDFKTVLFDIAVSVAMAFREDGDAVASSGGSFFTKIVGLMGLTIATSTKDKLAHINVSVSERKALATLSKALDYYPV
jgi:hypothetical protein